jgi:hypothetical protein
MLYKLNRSQSRGVFSKMNRIYQGRVCGVCSANPDTKASPEQRWLQLSDWDRAMWAHHELFQTAVNYYTLCLAAMAEGMDDPAFAEIAFAVATDTAARNPKHKNEAAREKAVAEAAETAKAMIAAIRAWRDAVEKTWVESERRGKKITGGYAAVAPILGVPVAAKPEGKDAFAACAATALAKSGATKEQRAAALLHLLEEAAKSDLNQLAVGRLPFFCTAKGELGAVSRAQASQQEADRQRLAIQFKEMPDDEAIMRASSLNLGLFLTTPPTEEIVGGEAVKTLRKYWEKTENAYPVLGAASSRLDAIAPKAAKSAVSVSTDAPLRIPAPGRKPSGIYPVAAVFRFVPCAETLIAFRAATASLCKANGKHVVNDPIADSRIEDTPHFAYFTNLAFHREVDAKQRAAWFEFDLAAFVEAVKSPHRYYKDTQARLAAGAGLGHDLVAMEGEGRTAGADEGEGGKHGLDGFAGDVRVDRLLAVLFSDLGHLGEVEFPDDDRLERTFITEAITRLGVELPDNSREYTLRERTLRSWRAVRDAWRDLHEKGSVTEDLLWEIVAKEQGEHRHDFGSARFYEALAEPDNHCIWRDKGTQSFHADDPVSAWAEYTELRRELCDKRRPIHFTPAHPKASPRFFIFPKKAAAGGKWGSTHEVCAGGTATVMDKHGMLAFTAGIAIRDGVKWRPVMTRITYRAPRLRRDGMRSDDEESLESAPWLQPMVKALGLAEPPVQDFGNCRITLQALAFENEDKVEKYNIQLTFPVEIDAEKLITQIGKQALWAKRFNLTPDGDNFRESTLRRKHEKQPKEPPGPLEDLIGHFTFGSVDFGLHADSWAMHEVRLDGKFTNKKGEPVASRAITAGDEPPWRLVTRELCKLRLPGSNATVWRKRGKNERDKKGEFDWREELYGNRGRSAKPEETTDCFQLMCELLGESYAWEFVSHEQELPADVQTRAAGLLGEFSFPQQNDKLIIVIRRAQSRLARIARWRTGIGDDCRREGVLTEIRNACGLDETGGKVKDEKTGKFREAERWIPVAIQNTAKDGDFAALARETVNEHQRLILHLPPRLVRIANRVLPLLGRSWEWARVGDREKEGRLHGLEQSGPKIEGVHLPGQRGLSIWRIEQIEELRRRIQSFNQAERRHHAAEQAIQGHWTADAAKVWVRRDFTDPCDDVLGKLDEIKTQRVNQSAHMILAQALGVRLAKPPGNKKALREECDQHGVYEKFRAPVDFIAIEDLSRYRTTQGRSPHENGRLMKWCHRAVRDKLRELCQPFGIPVLEVPAAYSSQFCARSGVIGFRAAEVTEGFETQAPWRFKLRVKDGEKETIEQQELRQLAVDLYEAQKAMEGWWRAKNGDGTPPKVTLLLPKQGGQIFVPIVDAKANDNRLGAKVCDADLNAAVNIGLRAVADPRMWEFFPRLRTERISGEVRYKGRKGKESFGAVPAGEVRIALRAREKRKYGENGPGLSLGEQPSGSAARETKQPNYFRDFADVGRLLWWLPEPADAETRKLLGFAKQFVPKDKAILPDPAAPSKMVEIVSSKAIFMALKRLQWHRCQEVNSARLARWKPK